MDQKVDSHDKPPLAQKIIALCLSHINVYSVISDYCKWVFLNPLYSRNVIFKLDWLNIERVKWLNWTWLLYGKYLIPFLISLFHFNPKAPPAALFMNSGRLIGKQRRMMGKWVFWMSEWFNLWLSLSVTPASSQPVFWCEKKNIYKCGFSGPNEVSAGMVVLHLKRWHRWVCHYKDRQSDRHTEVLPSVPPRWDARKPHAALL